MQARQGLPPGDRQVEEGPAGVGGIAHSHRHSHQPQAQGGFQGIGQGQGQVETAPQVPENPPFAAAGRVGDDLGHPGEALEQGGHPPGRQHRDLRLGKEFLQAREHRQAHDRVAYPVGGAHQEALHRKILEGKFPGRLQPLKTLLHFRGQGVFVRLRRMIHKNISELQRSAVSKDPDTAYGIPLKSGET